MIKVIGNWNALKWIRFIMGVFILIYGLCTFDWLLVIAGIFLVYMVIFNKGCAGGSCGIRPSGTHDKN